MFQCEGYEETRKDLFGFINKFTTRSYRRTLVRSDDQGKINTLIRSQPDFTLAYNVPGKDINGGDDYDRWCSDMKSLFYEFQLKRAQAFAYMWRWRNFAIKCKIDRGLLPVSPGGQAQRVSRNQNAGGGVVHTNNSMEDFTKK